MRYFKKYSLIIFVAKFFKVSNLHFELLKIDIFYCFASVVKYSKYALIFY